MSIKSKIHDFFFGFSLTKKLYCFLSDVKRKIRYGYQLALPIFRYKKRRKKPVFLIFTPEHANLGDHAIAYAEQQMLEKNGIDYYEITGAKLDQLAQTNYLGVMNKATILINGGGNLGTLWPDIERMNRRIIESNPKSKIIILPNSIFYEDSDYGRREFEESKRIYNSHKSLTIYAREKLSYQKMKTAYRDVRLAPDMVLSLNEEKDRGERSGCILCLRDDTERTLGVDERKKVDDFAFETFGENVRVSDTVLDHYVPVAERENELSKKFDEFGKAQLVITDRLHGMIFCAITGTNCIVLNSKSPKIRGCYEWISDLGYIRFADSADELKTVWNSVKSGKNVFDNRQLLEKTEALFADIAESVKG